MQQITPHLYQIALALVNCFVIDDKKGNLILIDTGYEGSTDKIFSAIEKAGKSPSAISHIILTHTHPDHAGSVAEIIKRTGAKVIAHPADAALAEKGIAGRLPHILSPGIANWIIYNLFIKGKPNQIPAFNTDQTVTDGETLPMLEGIRIIHTPGHSAGHLALYLAKDDILIAGDICANAMGPGLSAVYEDRQLGIQSILKATQIPFGKAVFGHGKPLMENASQKIRQKFS
jgi:glyoxylase-like metal-dependent hydrolase (beta-lactamase superfamily II)